MNLKVFKIEKKIDNENVVIFPTLIQNGRRNYLVDCGYEETFDEFELGLKGLGINIEDLTGIIITHDDIDHLGGLHLFKRKNKNLKVYSSLIEKDSVSGKIKSERLVQAKSLLENVADEHKTWALNFIQKLEKIRRFNVDETFKDRDHFENDITVIHTPGHTKGHISLFYKKEKTLIAGDAMIIENDTFNLANPAFTLNVKVAIKSIEKIIHLNPIKIICYHGGTMENNIDEKLKNLIKKFQYRV